MHDYEIIYIVLPFLAVCCLYRLGLRGWKFRFLEASVCLRRNRNLKAFIREGSLSRKMIDSSLGMKVFYACPDLRLGTLITILPRTIWWSPVVVVKIGHTKFYLPFWTVTKIVAIHNFIAIYGWVYLYMHRTAVLDMKANTRNCLPPYLD